MHNKPLHTGSETISVYHLYEYDMYDEHIMRIADHGTILH